MCFIPVNKPECSSVYVNLFINILILILAVASLATIGFCLGSLIHIRHHLNP